MFDKRKKNYRILSANVFLNIMTLPLIFSTNTPPNLSNKPIKKAASSREETAFLMKILRGYFVKNAFPKLELHWGKFRKVI